MSIAYTDVIRGAYQLLGRPSQADLPYQDVIDHAKDVIRGRLLDLKMAARGHTNVVGPWVGQRTLTLTDATNASPIVVTCANHYLATGQTVTISGVTGNTAANGTYKVTDLTNNTFSLDGSTGNGAYVSGGSVVVPLKQEMGAGAFVTGLTNFIPVKVEWRGISEAATAFPRKVEVVAYEQLGDLYRTTTTLSETYVAFTDNFQNIAFSETDETLATREYRVIYEALEDPTVTLGDTSSDFPAMFITLCKYETAVMCLDHVVNDSQRWMEKRERLRGSLTARLLVEDRRFTKWNLTLFGNKKVKRLGFRTRIR